MSVKYPPDWFSSGMVEVGTQRSPCTHLGHSEGGHGRGGAGRRQVMVTRSPAESGTHRSTGHTRTDPGSGLFVPDPLYLTAFKVILSLQVRV